MFHYLSVPIGLILCLIILEWNTCNGHTYFFELHVVTNDLKKNKKNESQETTLNKIIFPEKIL